MRTVLLTFLAAFLAIAQQDHQAMVNEHGDHVMGFSHEKTTHHFELHRDGGSIEVRAIDPNDTESRDQIQSHFQHIAQMFANGNFSAPMLVHGKEVPGTATMTQLKDKLHWKLEETPRGARLTVATDNKAGLHAVHQFLTFQIEDHKTGDSTAIR